MTDLSTAVPPPIEMHRFFVLVSVLLPAAAIVFALAADIAARMPTRRPKRDARDEG
jgi:hypothetical protein